VFGATIAAARLRRLAAGVAAHALGIALSFASGTWAFLEDGAMTKRLHPGHAAAAGLLATELAVQGMTGPANPFAAEWGGFLPTYARGIADPSALTAGLGERWRIRRSSIKPYASCRGTHAAVEAVLALRDGPPAERIDVAVTPTVARMCGGTQVATLLDAQMSLTYTLAVAWLFGAADLPSFAPAVRESAAVRDWMGRVRVLSDVAITSDVAARVTLHAVDGSTRGGTVESPIGSWDRPLPDAAVVAKYRSLAEPVLGPAQTGALQEAVWALGSGVSPHRLADLLGKEGTP
jgi:2-methylcitrate dehydratase PrpD